MPLKVQSEVPERFLILFFPDCGGFLLMFTNRCGGICSDSKLIKKHPMKMLLFIVQPQ